MGSHTIYEKTRTLCKHDTDTDILWRHCLLLFNDQNLCTLWHQASIDAFLDKRRAAAGATGAAFPVLEQATNTKDEGHILLILFLILVRWPCYALLLAGKSNEKTNNIKNNEIVARLRIPELLAPEEVLGRVI